MPPPAQRVLLDGTGRPVLRPGSVVPPAAVLAAATPYWVGALRLWRTADGEWYAGAEEGVDLWAQLREEVCRLGGRRRERQRLLQRCRRGATVTLDRLVRYLLGGDG